jgi:hypothetical protein
MRPVCLFSFVVEISDVLFGKPMGPDATVICSGLTLTVAYSSSVGKVTPLFSAPMRPVSGNSSILLVSGNIGGLSPAKLTAR